jgi:UDP-N-acetyl-D-galactosamine dehydrogenase
VVNKNFKIAVIGLGYVGLPVFLSFSKKFDTIGFDIDARRVDSLKKGIDRNREHKINKRYKKRFTNKIEDISTCNVFIITVPTPVNSKKKPVLSFIKNATLDVAKFLKKGDLVIYESTVYPGCTENFCGDILEKKSKLKLNDDYFLGYSPERINPGDKSKKIENITKVVSGSNQKALKMVSFLYNNIIKNGIHKAESIMIAEGAKIIENTQRDLNIAFINELKIIFEKLNINFDHVLRAAMTKWNFLNFYPGLVGGHCIGVDPYYLSYIANKNNINNELILSGRKINENMHKYYAKKFINYLYHNKLKIFHAKVLILGLAFKENIADYRNSKIFSLIQYLRKKKMVIDCYDPLIEFKKLDNQIINSKPAENKYDYIILTVAHDYFASMGTKKIQKYGKPNVKIFSLKEIFIKNNLIIKL